MITTKKKKLIECLGKMGGEVPDFLVDLPDESEFTFGHPGGRRPLEEEAGELLRCFGLLKDKHEGEIPGVTSMPEGHPFQYAP